MPLFQLLINLSSSSKELNCGLTAGKIWATNPHWGSKTGSLREGKSSPGTEHSYCPLSSVQPGMGQEGTQAPSALPLLPECNSHWWQLLSALRQKSSTACSKMQQHCLQSWAASLPIFLKITPAMDLLPRSISQDRLSSPLSPSK